MKAFFLIIALTLFLLNIAVIKVVNDKLSSTYMDEYFHRDQTVKYCEYRFDYWNNKLTTFPLL